MTSPLRFVPGTRSQIRGAVVVGLYLGVVIFWFNRHGVPLEREQVLAWLFGFVVIVQLTMAPTFVGVLRAVRDWLLLGLLFLAYDYSRGAADWFGFPLQVQTPINFDRALFPGDVPTVELQQWLRPFRGRRWWEAVMAVTYVSHFIVPYAITAVLWLRDRAAWRAWLARFSMLTLIGLTGYITLPTMPPWLAARQGHLEEVERVSTRGWRLLGLETAERFVDKGQATVNLVAAFPSLHAAYPALILGVFWPRTNRWVRSLLVAYVVVMGATLVIGGEHYVFDVVAGWGAAALALWAWRRLAARPRVQAWLAS